MKCIGTTPMSGDLCSMVHAEPHLSIKGQHIWLSHVRLDLHRHCLYGVSVDSLTIPGALSAIAMGGVKTCCEGKYWCCHLPSHVCTALSSRMASTDKALWPNITFCTGQLEDVMTEMN